MIQKTDSLLQFYFLDEQFIDVVSAKFENRSPSRASIIFTVLYGVSLNRHGTNFISGQQ